MEDPEKTEKARLQVGHILGPHGIRGEVRVAPTTDKPTRRFAPDSELEVAGRKLVVASARPQPDGTLLIKFAETTDRPAAAELKGLELTVGRSGPGWYRDDLVGAKVINREGVELGVVKEVTNTGSNDILELESGRLLPLIAASDPGFNPDKRELTITELEEI